jgi:serine/threonine protein kinase
MPTEVIGEGAFGSVYLSRIKDKGCVLKRINYEKRNDVMIMSPSSIREATFLSHINHECVIKPIKITKDFIFMPYCCGDLTSLRTLSWGTYLDIFYQTLLALAHIHGLNIIHGDIKPQNILIHDGKIKLCDFNLSSIDNNQLRGDVYTSSYRPLEVIFSTYNKKSDIWALGCTMWELYFNKPLFVGVNKLNAVKKISSTLGPIPKNICAKYNIPNSEQATATNIFTTGSDSLNDLLKQMLNYDRDNRPSVFELLNHELFRTVAIKYAPEIKVDRKLLSATADSAFGEFKQECHKERFISQHLVENLLQNLVKFHGLEANPFYYWVCFCAISFLYIGHEVDFYEPPLGLDQEYVREIDFGLAVQDILQKINFNLLF